jgi:hypothetical protein
MYRKSVNTNWYKEAKEESLYDQIRRNGPHGPSDPSGKKFDDMSEDERAYMQRHMREWYRRDNFISQYGFSTPTEEAVDRLVKFIDGDGVLEIGAGYGLWAKLLQDKGVNVTAVDSHDKAWTDRTGDEIGAYDPRNQTYTDIKIMDHMNALSAYGHFNVLMMVWPDYQSLMATEATQKFKGSKMIYIGEGYSGCTGSDCFHEELNKWEEVERIDIPQWEGIHDSLYLYTRTG